MVTIRIVIAEDSALLREGVVRLIDGAEGFEVVGACEDLPDLLAAPRRRPQGLRPRHGRRPRRLGPRAPPAAWRDLLPVLLTEVADAWKDPGAWEGETRVGGIALPPTPRAVSP